MESYSIPLDAARKEKEELELALAKQLAEEYEKERALRAETALKIPKHKAFSDAVWKRKKSSRKMASRSRARNR